MTVDGDLQATFAATLVDEWARAGVAHAVVAPGSRSTPLALALVRDGRLRVHVVLDERSAAFFALGVGAATGAPAVVVTTSGTAAVELHPAVVEAAHAGVPLIAATADRPWELRDVGAPQTVDQSPATLFGAAVRWSADPGVADDASRAAWRSLGARAVVEAVARAGPVHLNLPFRDPLVGTPGALPPGRPDGAPWHEAPTSPPPARSGTWKPLRSGGVQVPERAVVVAGRGADGFGDVVAWAGERGWPVLADPLSGCRVPAANVVAAFDALLRVDRFRAAVTPDLVVRVGAPPASKVLAQWLAGLPEDVPQVQVAAPGTWPDPDRTASQVLAALPDVPGPAPGHWLGAWRAAEEAAQRAIDAALAAHGTTPTEPGVARALVDALPGGSRLVVSSSMPIRDVEWYARPRTGVTVHANRGANGIDGVVSTALGVAAGSGAPTAALLGDLALLHDAGGLLWATRREGVDCTLVVVDNDGGGIFSFLPQAGDAAVGTDTFERLFGTPHGVDLRHLAALHGIDAVDAVSLDGVRRAATATVPGSGVRLVLARVPDRAGNVAVHRAIHDAVADAC